MISSLNLIRRRTNVFLRPCQMKAIEHFIHFDCLLLGGNFFRERRARERQCLRIAMHAVYLFVRAANQTEKGESKVSIGRLENISNNKKTITKVRPISKDR